jgi:hypothetical protein
MERSKIYIEKGLTEAFYGVSLMLILGKRLIRGYISRDAYSGLICDCLSSEVSYKETPIIFLREVDYHETTTFSLLRSTHA